MAARYISMIVGAVGASFSFSSIAKNTLWHKEYAWKYLQLKDENNRPVPVDQTTRELTEDILFRLNLLPHVEAGLEFFTCKGFEPTYVGSLLRNTGCSIGIPAFATIERESKEQLSRNLKSFVIAKEILNSIHNYDINYQWAQGLGVSASLMAAPTVFGRIAKLIMPKDKAKNFRYPSSGPRSISLRVLPMLITFLLILNYKQYYARKEEKKVLQLVYELSPDLAKGGVEYYEALLAKNLKLCEEHPKNGLLYNNSTGENYWGMPFYHRDYAMRHQERIDFLKNCLEKE